MRRVYRESERASQRAVIRLVSLLAFAGVVFVSQSAYSQDDVRWFEPGSGPSADADSPPVVFQPPPPPRPKGAFALDLSPIIHRNSAVSGGASIVRARLSYQAMSFFVGMQTPGTHFITGVDFNPLGGVELGAIKLPEAYKLWVLGPRLGTTLLLGLSEGVRGLGVHGEAIGVRLTRCGGVCSFVDVRGPALQYMLVTTNFTPEGEPELIRSLGASMSAGIAF